MNKKSKKINQEIYWQHSYLTIRKKNWRRLMFAVCCVTVVILLSLLILNPFSPQTIQKQPQISIKQHAQTNKSVSSKYKSSRSKMNNFLSQDKIIMSRADTILPRSLTVLAIDNSGKQKDIYGNKQQALSPSIADFAQSLFSPDALINSKTSSLHAMQKLHQKTLANTTALQVPSAMNQSKSKIIVSPQAAIYHSASNLPTHSTDFVSVSKDPTSKLISDALVTNKALMTDAQARSIARKNIFTRQVINSKKMPLTISKNENISHINNSLDHKKLPDQFTQKHSAIKLTASNKKQANDLSHSLTLQVASLHDPIEAQLIKAKLNSKGFPSRVEEFKLGGRMFYRVRVGAYSSRNDAHEVANKLKAAGYHSDVSGQ